MAETFRKHHKMLYIVSRHTVTILEDCRMGGAQKLRNYMRLQAGGTSFVESRRFLRQSKNTFPFRKP